MKNALNIDNEIIVCGFNTFNAYGVVRSLGEGGIKPIVIINKCPNPFISKSKYVKDVIYFDKPDSLPDIVKNRLITSHIKPIIICCDDPIQSAFDKRYDELKDQCILSNASNKSGEITRLMNKTLQGKIAEECGLLVPRSWVIKTGESIPGDITYPCIIKPLLSIGGVKADIKICKELNELKRALDNKDYLVQEYINKDYEAMIWGTSLQNDEYYFTGLGRKIRQYPNKYSISSFGIIEDLKDHPEVDVDSIDKFLKALDYKGMFNIEFAVKDNRYYFLEINLRNGGKQYFTTIGGENLPLMYVNSVLGHKLQKPNPQYPIYFMGETTDIKHIFKKEISLRQYYHDFRNANAFFIFNKKDPMPFIYQLFKKFLNRIFK